MSDMNLNERIEKALAEIRPFLNNDGGDIELVSVEGDTVTVQLTGTCTECSINQMTLKSGVEMTIKKYAPEVSTVINASGVNPLMGSKVN
ncbi:NifU family protein [Moheibacter sediminis]|uniref:Fe-S cluster biogenesis protein NfuA, 4Fe-4S-binding domain n=1 Tax=Moheibacter sediminis TaxID=1434700 RepID=A0A1W2CV35_9FLAO|nr:NifU family protein [Moheibacter sediminis]SMC88836.1 Fe-S cluster biogenesis protein NfuA, 4Fe-4S-binding domain [Moheibacter sediminis]